MLLLAGEQGEGGQRVHQQSASPGGRRAERGAGGLRGQQESRCFQEQSLKNVTAQSETAANSEVKQENRDGVDFYISEALLVRWWLLQAVPLLVLLGSVPLPGRAWFVRDRCSNILQGREFGILEMGLSGFSAASSCLLRDEGRMDCVWGMWLVASCLWLRVRPWQLPSRDPLVAGRRCSGLQGPLLVENCSEHHEPLITTLQNDRVGFREARLPLGCLQPQDGLCRPVRSGRATVLAMR